MAFTKITNAGFGLTTGTLVGVAASFSSTVSVGGTLTYEDVTNVDSVGLITARNGIEVTDKGVQVGTGATIDGATNTLTFLTNGSERIRIQSDGDVGIGTDDPGAYQLHVHSEDYRALQLVTNNDGANGPEIRLRHNSASPADDDTIGQIVFTTNDSGGNQSTVVRIDGIVTDVTDGTEDGVLTFSTRSNGSFGERLRLDSSGRLLLGTTSSVSGGGGDLLEVASGVGNILITSTNSTRVVDQVCGQLRFWGKAGANEELAKIAAVADGTHGSGDKPTCLVFSTTADNASSPTERLRIDSSGRLMLGTTTEGEASADDLTVASSANTGITIRSGSTSPGSIYFSDGTSGNAEYRGYIDYNHNGDYLRFATAASERMRIDSSGNMGLGTNSPTSVLHIKSDTNNNVNNGFLFEAADSTHKIFRLYENGTGEAYSRWYYQDSAKVLIRSNGSSYLNGGDFGIGTESPALKLHVEDSVSQIIRFARTGTGAGSLDVDSSGNAVLNSHTTDKSVVFHTQATERARINSSGQLLVGTTSEVSDSSHAKVHIASTGGGALALGRDDSSVTAGNGIGLLRFYGNDGGSYQECARIEVAADGTHANNDKPARMEFHTTLDGASSPSEQMRITSDGVVNFGDAPGTNANADLSGSGNKLYISLGHTFGANAISTNVGAYTGTYSHNAFYNGNGLVGTINTNGSSTNFNTSSDYRLKENVVDLADGITRVKQLQPRRFNFIADATTTVDGFLAHEAQTVVPEAVTGTHNEVDDDGNAVMQGIDQSKLVPLLTAALQEAIAEIETLKTKVAALEG